MSNNELPVKLADENDVEKYKGIERNEEIRDIIERMPSKFGYWISVIVLFIFCLLLFFGWAVRYPDVVKGTVTINTSIAPIKLISNSSGRIKLNNITSQSSINTDYVIAYIENATSYDTLKIIKQLFKNYDPNNFNNTSILSALPTKVALGEITSKYYNFLSSLHQLRNYNADKLYEKQIRSLENLHVHQLKELKNSTERININKDALRYSKKNLMRDSILFHGKAATESELDATNISYLSSLAGFSNARSSQIEAEKQAQQTLSKISEVNVQKSEKRNELEIALLASYNDLMDNIKLWEQKYLFVAPFDGQVQFLRFWTNKQFIQQGESVFTIVPDTDKPYGQVLLPALGAGKVKVGQEVIIKLDDFPYNEYGSITGRVNSISLTANIEKSSQANIETYLVTVKFPKGLTTNYGRKLAFRHESKGTAEIITNDRKLIERLFGNLKYVLNK